MLGSVLSTEDGKKNQTANAHPHPCAQFKKKKSLPKELNYTQLVENYTR